MKKLLILVAALLCAPFFSKAQTVEITPFGGYVFPSTLNAANGEVQFLGNAQYGGMLSVGVSRVMDVDLIYNRIDTKADIYAYGNYNYLYDTEIPLSINYMHIGFTKNFRVKPIVSPFVSFNLGACLFAPKETDNGTYQSAWFFSMGWMRVQNYISLKGSDSACRHRCYIPCRVQECPCLSERADQAAEYHSTAP
jgi:hypothetical protein